MRPIPRRRKRRKTLPNLSLRFTPTAWAKFLFLRDRGETEVGGFGISALDDPLLMEDVRLVRQVCSAVTVAFDDAGVADYFDARVDEGLDPERFARVWLHTHPGDSPHPSHTDEETFLRVFGSCDWAVMGILAHGGASYARLRFRAGPGGELRIPMEVDFQAPFAGSDPARWDAEYRACVAPLLSLPSWSKRRDVPIRDPFETAFDDFWNPNGYPPRLDIEESRMATLRPRS